MTTDAALTLAAAVLWQAVVDARRDDPAVPAWIHVEALLWLRDDPWAAELAMAVGVDPGALRDWAVRRMEVAA